LPGARSDLVPLLPEQARFLERDLEHPHHWNVSALYAVPASLPPSRVRDAFRRIVARHDGLRMRLRSEGAELLPADDPRFEAEVRSAPRLAEPDLADFVTEDAAALQTAFDLREGPLVRLVYYPHRSRGRLLLLAHHLLVDQVAWASLEAELDAELDGGRVRGPATSYEAAVSWFSEQARAPAIAADAPAWEGLVGDVVGVEPGRPGGTNTMAFNAAVRGRLDPVYARELLSQERARSGITMNAVALVAVLNALAPEREEARLTINLIGSGRRGLRAVPDLSRTVGDFTCLYPVTATIRTVDDLATQLRTAQAQLERVPTGGVGFGLLKYLGPPESAARMRRLRIGDVTVNYVGRRTPGRRSVLGETPESTGEELAPSAESDNVHEIDFVSDAGALELRWYASTDLYPEAQLAGYVRRALRALSDFRLGAEAVEVEVGA
jgi:non-ribosomal peptide synthase protein (TIGR01720 family)